MDTSLSTQINTTIAAETMMTMMPTAADGMAETMATAPVVSPVRSMISTISEDHSNDGDDYHDDAMFVAGPAHEQQDQQEQHHGQYFDYPQPDECYSDDFPPPPVTQIAFSTADQSSMSALDLMPTSLMTTASQYPYIAPQQSYPMDDVALFRQYADAFQACQSLYTGHTRPQTSPAAGTRTSSMSPFYGEEPRLEDSLAAISSISQKRQFCNPQES
uniref:Uncharacterized protein n=1 Tax=Craspedostauros australis TaxID=1486917 RepID=A0A7R9X0W2_9STRA|mmetsp:Transcript_4939/g.13056  ORF Transcript_4939/g.13056 Transcript_4939/m.13056 type:complete len:217 (+) Transcript_4939:410-1060(+)